MFTESDLHNIDNLPLLVRLVDDFQCLECLCPICGRLRNRYIKVRFDAIMVISSVHMCMVWPCYSFDDGLS